MWKQVYIDHQATHRDSYLVEETLKDQLQDTLKTLKIRTSIEEGSKRAMLQVLLAHHLLFFRKTCFFHMTYYATGACLEIYYKKLQRFLLFVVAPLLLITFFR
jgi:hypothetical protein